MSMGGFTELRELFLRPAAAPVLLLVPLAWVAWRRSDRSRARLLAGVLGPRARALASELSLRRRRLGRALAVAGLALACVALLQPAWGEVAGEPPRSDILVCLDVSRSMLARDSIPASESGRPRTRLESARAEIRALCERARGERLGLIAFAGEARLLVPFTADTEAFQELLELAEPESVERGGTDLGAALERALDVFETQALEKGTVLLVTDGEDHELRGLRAAERCRERGLSVHCLGLGSALGSKIPLTAELATEEARAAGEAFLSDRSGRQVISAMDPASLRALAEAGAGTFVEAGAEARALVRLYEERILPAATRAPAHVPGEPLLRRENRFQWPLLAAFVLWILELCLTDRRR